MDDIKEIYRQFSDRDMCKYFSDPPCDEKEAKNIIERFQNSTSKSCFRYSMFDKKTGAFIGTCGYHCLDNELKQVEIGYDIWKDYWKQGYISEALPELIDLCFEYLGVNCIYILVHPQNIASIKTAEKFGFTECEPCRKFDAEPQICMKRIKNV